jgi:type I restriction enzyme R subunit
MYDKVQKHWKAYLKDVRDRLKAAKDADEREGLAAKVKFMQQTDMAVVVSQSQNEVEDLKKKAADITPHRRRMVKEDLDGKIKDPDDPFRIVFVCAMWMTGFDVPSCSTRGLRRRLSESPEGAGHLCAGRGRWCHAGARQG